MFLYLVACAEPPLDVAGRAERVRALADGRTDDDDEAEIVDLMAAVDGAELRAVKRRLDVGTEDLHHLVFTDIDDAPLRARLLAHLATSGDGLERPVMRVLSDIDDTVVCSLIDARYPQWTVYPGVRAFYRELAVEAGSGELPTWLTFVSARPEDRLEAVEAVSVRSLESSGFSSFTVLSGTFTGLASHGGMAEAKYGRFVQHHQIWPEERHVFVGDDGQGDPEFGARLRTDFGDAVSAVFLHDVVSDDGVEDRTPEEHRATDAALGLIRFDSYAGAARAARARGLLSDAAAARVVAEARTELAAVVFDDPAKAAARLAELEADANR